MSLRARDLVIVHRDAHLLVLAKPPGIATTSPDDGPSLFALARELDPQAPQLHPLSRLDRPVSGLVSFARDKLANEVARRARSEGKLHRRYLALTAGVPEPERGTWTAAIAIDDRDVRKRRAVVDGARGRGLKEASTDYALLAQAGPLCALDLWPKTGRTHQLRVHAAHAGIPLLGDPAYGGEKRVTLANGRVLTAQRVMLHCAHVRMPNPGEPAETISLHLAPPEDMLRVFRGAGGEDALLSAPRDA